MSNLSIVAVLHRLRAIKTLLHDGETKGAAICVDDMLKKITNSEHICARCGCQINIVDCHMAGDYCESCSVEINQ